MYYKECELWDVSLCQDELEGELSWGLSCKPFSQQCHLTYLLFFVILQTF